MFGVETIRRLIAGLLRHPAVEYFVPEELRGLDQVVGYRARTLVGFTYAVATLGFVFGGIYSLGFGLHAGGVALAGGGLAAMGAPVILRRTGRLDWAGNWLCFDLYGVVVYLVTLTGGLQSPTVEWLLPVPIYGLLFGGMSFVLGWMVLVGATFAVLYALPLYGVQLPQMLDASQLHQLQFLGLAGLTFLLIQLVLLSQWVHEWVIRKLGETQEELESRARRDALTELPNRRFLESHFEEVVGHRADEEGPLGFGLVDLDDFKMVNDSIGHPAGDKVLEEVGARLREVAGEDDFVARVGGDEFVLLLESPEAEDELDGLGDKLEGIFAESIDLSEAQVHLSASIGLVGASSEQIRENDRANLLQDLVHSADRAMYAAKEVPGTSWKVRKLGTDRRESQPLHLENRVRQAVERDEFAAHFQPIFDATDRKLYGAEVLARWDHPEKGILSAGEFIPLAQRSELIEHIGRAVIEDAYLQLDRSGVLEQLDETFELFLNLSPRQLQVENSTDAIDELLRHLEHPKVEPRLEVTEKHWLRNTDDIIGLRERGYSLVLDDFGQGYSSLSRLTELPVDGIKIDRAFVSKMADSRADAMVVELVAEFGKRLDVPVIAEGIETEAQMEAVARADATGAQGYHLARPRPAEVLAERIEAGGTADPVSDVDAASPADSDESSDASSLREGSSVTFGSASSLAAESSGVTISESPGESDPDPTS